MMVFFKTHFLDVHLHTVDIWRFDASFGEGYTETIFCVLTAEFDALKIRKVCHMLAAVLLADPVVAITAL